MAESMTGYGRAEGIAQSIRFLIEMKTVNNRFCDVQIRMPRALLALEPQLKDRISSRLLRGKADVFISTAASETEGTTVKLNRDLARAYSEALSEIAAVTGRPDDAGSSVISRMPEVLVTETVESDPEALRDELFSILDEALDSIVRMRRTEGDKLVTDLLGKADALEEMLTDVGDRAKSVPAEYREKLFARIEELMGDNAGIYFDEGRKEAEVVMFADRCAIDEEMTRLRSHIGQLKSTLTSDGSIGKRLDFILQEMNREVNTIGSKANDLAITRRVLDMKTELEKIREQIQNLV
ncbi:MAG: YicC family protein [Clostridiales bacterium]|jgi:uncharacterized protein (TIGR00255 family)|nr:YicC family protein [Clostridiales bacterium]